MQRAAASSGTVQLHAAWILSARFAVLVPGEGERWRHSKTDGFKRGAIKLHGTVRDGRLIATVQLCGVGPHSGFCSTFAVLSNTYVP